MQLQPHKKIYFASDFHLGLPMDENDKSRELLICQFLNECAKDAQHIFLLGDLFDAWFEYKEVIPKGFTRFLGTLAALSDRGIKITIFPGNHDLWMRDYFQKEINADVFFEPKRVVINDTTFFLGHGDGLGPGDKQYKMMKQVIAHPIAQKLYKFIHPDIGVSIAKYFSRKGAKHVERADPYRGDDKEWLTLFCKEKLQQRHYDYFIFGHRHLPLTIPIGEHSEYINLGDWIKYNSYAVFDGEEMTLKYYSTND